MIEALVLMGVNPVAIGDLIHFGQNEWINTKTGQSQLQQWREAAEIKRAYSKQVVLTQAKKAGWQIKTNPKDQYQFQLIKR